ncbi:MAG: hypothetical protein JSV43_01200 [Methanobacteriota archaeon]|nr:MAG: hypothetical protein JSV43_01200 [Euryarchaeota archaeon]
MLTCDVTKSVVIIIIATVVGALFVTPPQAEAAWNTGESRPAPLPIHNWVWENGTFVVETDILVNIFQTFTIRNATVVMHSKHELIGMRVLGVLRVDDSTIKSMDETGYYLEVMGAAIINNSTIEGVYSRDPIGNGIISLRHFELVNSTLSSHQGHAITFYAPYVGLDYITNSEVQGVAVLNSVVSVSNSSIGPLCFTHGASEVYLYNSTYSDLGAAMGFGYVYSFDYMQVHTSLPEADLSITDVFGYRMDVGKTDDNGYYRSWWMSRMVIVDTMQNHVFNYNHLTFEAWKTVEGEYAFHLFNGRTAKLSFSQNYYGVTVQDIEENPFVEIEMMPV